MSDTMTDIESNKDSTAPSEVSGFTSRCGKLMNLLGKHERAYSSQQIRDDYLNLSTRLTQAGDRLQQVLTRYQVLRKNVRQDDQQVILLPLAPETVQMTIFLLKEFRQVLAEKHEQARQDDSLPKLTESLGTLTDEIKLHIASVWKQYIADLSKQWYVKLDLLQVQLLIADNQATHAQYVSFKEQFEQLSSKAHQSQEAFNTLHLVHSKLVTLRQNMKLDIPPEVNEFLIDAARQRGTSIEKLTPTVLDWLTNHDDVAAYRIKRI